MDHLGVNQTAAMTRTAFAAPLGEVWVWSEPSPAAERPALLVIGGAFQAERSAFLELPGRVAADVHLTHLPGNHCPELAEASVAAYAAALSAWIRAALPGRRLVVCGVSVGALVALSLDPGLAQRLLLIDPPLSTAKAWPLAAPMRARAFGPGAEPWARRFVEGVLGIYPERVEERGYAALAARPGPPAAVLLGEVPLMPPRPLDGLPSLVDEPERELLRSRPDTRMIEVPGAGHSLPFPPVHRCLQLLAQDLAT